MKRQSEGLSNITKKLKCLEQTQELGIIESICLKNFMCHDHLKFDFDPHINFIIGQNGSGKSAILTGIILALGGKSSTTGRYANIKGFIKTGRQKAQISVVLKNCGDFAFKPEEYGEKVIVEREISAEGASAYKLKSSTGRIVSTQKEELNNLLTSMDIQVENPVLVLTQETSRNFLLAKTGKEEKLYEFFYRGTGLYQIEEGYRNSENMINDAKGELFIKEKALPEMKKDLLRWKNIVNSSEKIDDLKKELLWATVRVMEEKLMEREKELQKAQKEVDTFKAEAEKCKVANKAKTDIYDKLLKERDECDVKISTCRNTIKELSADIEKHADNVRKSQGTVELFARQEKKLAEDITGLEKSILETQMKNQMDFEDLKQKRCNEIAKLEFENSEASKRQEQLKMQNEMILKERNEQYSSVDMLNAERNALENNRRNLISKIQQMKDAVKNRQVLFGKCTPMVLEEIQRRKREFRKLPRGPIGLDIEVKDPRWNNAIEACLKYTLNSFCCDNAEDSRLLTSILKKYYDFRMPSILISPFLSHVHDVSRYKCRSNYPTVFDMLKINDPVIANCLIDQHEIERIILVEDINTAQTFMLDHPPQFCKSAYLLNCDEILLNPYRHYAATRKITNSVLQTIDQTYISSLEQEQRHVVGQIQNNQSQLKSIKANIQNYPSVLEKIEIEIVKLTQLQNRNAGKIFDLKQFEEVKDVSVMQDDLLAMKQDHDEKTRQLGEAEAIYNQYKSEFQETNSKFQEQKKLLAREKIHFDELGTKINAAAKAKEVLVSAKNKYEADGKKAESNLKSLREEFKTHKKETEASQKKASEMCRKIKTERSPQEIQSQIAETEKVIRESSNCDKDDLFEKYKERHDKLQQATKDLSRIDRYIKTEDRMLHQRKNKLKDIIKHTQNCIDMAFTVCLKGNRCTGRLDFSKPGRLKLEATPRTEKGKNSCHSLSGGERSFVTIAFLLALWDRIKMPFRILDEYDVFMDSNNRNLSINLLIKRAEHMRNVQFIFLSPLELPDIKDSEHIKVHKMPAPERIGLKELTDMDT